MSCDEYEAYLADPRNFRSDHQRQQECAERESRELEAVRRARSRVEMVMMRRQQQKREAHDAAVARGCEEEGEEGETERLERARREQERYEEERMRAAAEGQRRAEGVERRRVEDLWSERRIVVSTKACPRCAARIEKDEGW